MGKMLKLSESEGVAKNDVTEAVNTVLDAVQGYLSDKPVEARDMY